MSSVKTRNTIRRYLAGLIEPFTLSFEGSLSLLDAALSTLKKSVPNGDNHYSPGAPVTTSYTPLLANGSVHDLTLANTTCTINAPTMTPLTSGSMTLYLEASAGGCTLTLDGGMLLVAGGSGLTLASGDVFRLTITKLISGTIVVTSLKVK